MLFGSKNGRFSAVSASPEPVRSGHRAIVFYLSLLYRAGIRLAMEKHIIGQQY